MGKNKKNRGKKSEMEEPKTKGFAPAYSNYICIKHPILKIPGVKGVLTGGRDTEQMKGADVLVMLDSLSGIKYNMDTGGGLWYPQRIIMFGIADRKIPTEFEMPKFRKLLKLLTEELKDGGHVHVHCMGGHGRTGTVLGCLVGMLTDASVVEDPVKWVREKYCKKAVETEEQHKLVYKLGGREIEVAPKEYYVATSPYAGYGFFEGSSEDYFRSSGGHWDPMLGRWIPKRECWDPSTQTWIPADEYDKKYGKNKKEGGNDESINESAKPGDPNFRTEVGGDYPPYTRLNGSLFPSRRYWGNHSD